MPRLSLTLTEQHTDARSNEVAYKLMLENHGATAVRLLSITPRIPDSAELIRIKDTTLEEAKEKHQKLCDELSAIIRDHILIISKETRERLVQIEIDQLDAIIGSTSGIWRAYARIINGQLKRSVKEARTKADALIPLIESKADADSVFKRWFAKNEQLEPATRVFHDVFKTKLEKLAALEETTGRGSGLSVVATIEPDSIFAETYVLQFQRSYLEPRKLNFSVDASYADVDKEERLIGAATVSVVISPRPYILSVIAVLSSVLGVILKFSVTETAKGRAFVNAIAELLVSGQTMAGGILALVIFNVYEFTEFTGKLKLLVGWRSALLVGVLCGLLSERMVAALKAFVGT